MFSFSLGYLYDEAPIPDGTIDYDIPSGDRHVVSTGLGVALGDWTIDAMYALVTLADERRIEAMPRRGYLGRQNRKRHCS